MDSVFDFIAGNVRVWLVTLFICVVTVILASHKVVKLSLAIKDPNQHRLYKKHKRSLENWILADRLAHKVGIATLALFLGAGFIQLARIIF